MEVKQCNKCFITYPLEIYYRNGNNRDKKAHICPTCSRANSKLDRTLNHYSYYARKYKTTPEVVQELIERVVCEICQAPPKPTKRNFIDHCHTTGKVRGLLCDDCNMGIGRFKDSTERLEKAKQYLEKYGS